MQAYALKNCIDNQPLGDETVYANFGADCLDWQFTANSAMAYISGEQLITTYISPDDTPIDWTQEYDEVATAWDFALLLLRDYYYPNEPTVYVYDANNTTIIFCLTITGMENMEDEDVVWVPFVQINEDAEIPGVMKANSIDKLRAGIQSEIIDYPYVPGCGGSTYEPDAELPFEDGARNGNDFGAKERTGAEIFYNTSAPTAVPKSNTPNQPTRSGSDVLPTEVWVYTYSSGDWKDQLESIAEYTVDQNTGYLEPNPTITSYTYDDSGSPTNYGDKTLTWEGKRPSSIIDGNVSIEFEYDENGLRTSKTVDNVTTYYHYNGSVLIGMQQGNDALRFSYDASGSVVSVNLNGIDYYYLRNGQGDVVALIDGSGTKVVEYEYDSWGTPTATTGTLAATLGELNPFRYRGYVYDQETGWYYLKSRYFDPSTSRFISADALLSTGQGVLGYNMYAYCLNNPANRHDPSGCCSHTGTGEDCLSCKEDADIEYYRQRAAYFGKWETAMNWITVAGGLAATAIGTLFSEDFLGSLFLSAIGSVPFFVIGQLCKNEKEKAEEEAHRLELQKLQRQIDELKEQLQNSTPSPSGTGTSSTAGNTRTAAITKKIAACAY